MSPLPATTLAVLVVVATAPLRAVSATAERHVDLVLRGDLTGDGRISVVEWYRLGPFSPACPKCPTDYVRGVAVTDPAGKVSPAARWESQRTTLPDFYPELNTLWSVPDTKGGVITGSVQYGGAVIELHAFLFRGGRLQEIGAIGGRGISVKQLGAPPRTVLVVKPSDWNEMYELYTWKEGALARGDEDFPEFWHATALGYLSDISSPRPVSPFALAADCRAAARCFRLAHETRRALDACLQARARIASRQALAPNLPQESPAQLREESRDALSEIADVLAYLRGSTGADPP